MQMLWLAVAITGTVGYHVILKLTPAGANPYLSLSISFAIGAVVFATTFAVAPGAPLRESISQLNWTAVALGLVVTCLDFGFMMLYRTGFDVSLGQIITQSAGALLLVLLGVAFFAEKLTFANIGGIALCVIGLWLINQK